MLNAPSKSEKTYLTILTLTVWYALVLQFYLHMNSGMASVPELVIRFFSYFTIDSNLLIALCSTCILCFPKTKIGEFFATPSAKTAITMYIMVVMLIYNTVLRFLWVLEGWSIVANELLHVIVPLMFLFYWIYFVAKHQLRWSNIWLWLLYPLLYTVFVLVRGSFADFYPYPFLNVTKFGFNKVLVNCMLVTLLFAFLSLLFIGIGRRVAKFDNSQD